MGGGWLDVGDSPAHSLPPSAAGDHKYFANYKEGSDLIKKRLSGGLRGDDDGGWAPGKASVLEGGE